jgi:hypothetical protein
MAAATDKRNFAADSLQVQLRAMRLYKLWLWFAVAQGPVSGALDMLAAPANLKSYGP